MELPRFEMERWQSTYEHHVDYNLSESGVHPLNLEELLHLIGIDPADVLLAYTQSDGTGELKGVIAGLFPGASSANVLVTTGGAEANYLAMRHLVSPGDRVVVLEPTYGQTPGLAAMLGAALGRFHLDEAREWQPPPGAPSAAIPADTRLVVVTNPNNPTGAVLSETSMNEIVDAAAAAGAWILADEVYAGAEMEGAVTSSFWGRYDRVVVTGSLSKAYGLPGLRLGWIIAPDSLHEDLWARKDYTTISPNALSDAAARAALQPDRRDALLARTRDIIRTNFSRLESWLTSRPHAFHFRPPAAGAICFVRYRASINSSVLAERLRTEQGVLVVPGDHFGMDGYLRLGFGSPGPELDAALGRIGVVIDSLPPLADAGLSAPRSRS